MWIISTRNSGLRRLAVSNLHKISPCGSCHETSISKLDGNKSSPPVNTPQTPLLPQPFLGLGKTFIEINSDILFDRPNTAALLFFFLLSCRCCSFSTHCRRKGASCGNIMLICRHEELGLTWVWQNLFGLVFAMRVEAGKCGFLGNETDLKSVVVASPALEGLFWTVLCLILTTFNLRLV